MPDDKNQDIKEYIQSFWHKLAVGDEQNPAWLTTFWKMLRVFWRKLTIGDDQHKPWASNPIVVVLSLLFLFPVGVWFLFWFTNWNKKVQWSLVAFCGLVFISRIGGSDAAREAAQRVEKQNVANEQLLAEVEQSVPLNGSKNKVVESKPRTPDAEHPKLKAFRAVIAKLQDTPGDFVRDNERYAYNNELQKLISNFDRTEIDIEKDRESAIQVVKLFESRVEKRFSGHLFNILEDHISTLYLKL